MTVRSMTGHLILALTTSCVVAVLLPGFLAVSHAGPKTSETSRHEPCVKLVTSASPSAKVQAKAKVGAKSPRIVVDARNKALLKPMTRDEVKMLIVMLQPEKLKDGGGYRLASRQLTGKLSTERAGVLMQDITAELTRIHLGELLQTLKGLPDVNKTTLEWGQHAAQALDFCGDMRYLDYGGDIALQLANTIVLENREILERLILETKLPGRDLLPGIP